MPKLTRDRAERIARAHACENCGEYSYKKLVIKPSIAGHKAEFNEVWHATKICGVCGMAQEMGIDDDGEIVYAG